MIPVNEPLLAGKELEYVTECVRTGWISSAGHFIEEFEQRWAEYCGRKHGIAVCNGTAALEVAVRALDLGPGDEVIVPTFTIISCIQAILRAGARPVLVDSEPRTWTMDVGRARERVNSRTRAIMPVHIYGHPADVDPLLELAEEHGLVVIEDAAEAHGAEYSTRAGRSGGVWKRCGSFGDVSCFSFYANKIITTGEGGMVLTDDDRLAARARSLRNLCFGEPRFRHEELGFNFRMTNLQAAIGVAQIERIQKAIDRKRAIARCYQDGLRDASGLLLQTEEVWGRSVYWMFGVLLDETCPFDAAEFSSRLRAVGVDTRPFFLGMHEQPALRARGLFEAETFPVAERLARRGTYLPSGMALSDDQVDEVCRKVHETLR